MPPVGETVALPSLPPKQLTSVFEGVGTFNTVGCPMVTPCVAVQPLLSVAVTLYVPAERPLTLAVVFTGLVPQEYV